MYAVAILSIAQMRDYTALVKAGQRRRSAESCGSGAAGAAAATVTAGISA